MKVTGDPWQKGFEDAAMDTVGIRLLLVTMLMVLDIATFDPV